MCARTSSRTRSCASLERTAISFACCISGIGSPDATLCDTLVRMVGFRNMLVHDLDSVNLAIVRWVVERHLGDLLAFVRAIRRKLDERRPCPSQPAPVRRRRNPRLARRRRHGEVYRARDTRLKREVALTLLPDALAADPDRVARFQREAEVLATLTHPHIA